jgi:WD domain, G-beta repeat
LKYKTNSRTDIFALGCIIFEIMTSRRLFSGDWAVHEYAQKGTPILLDQWPLASPGSRLHELRQLTSTLLSIEPRERPGASEVRERLLRLQTRAVTSEGNEIAIPDDDFFDLEQSDPLEELATTDNPDIQSALQFLGQRRVRQSEPHFPIYYIINFFSCVVAPFSLFDEDLESTPEGFKQLGDDWFAVFNKHVPRQLGVTLLHTFEHNSMVCSVRFSTDGRYLATGCNWTAQIFDVKTGQKTATLNHESAEPDLHIRSVCFTPDGRYLATGAEDKKIRVWDIARQRIKNIFTGHEEEVYTIDISGDGTRLASGSGDMTTRLWDMATAQCLLRLPIEDGVTSVALSPDGTLLAAGSFDKGIRVWDTAKGALLEHLVGHHDKVSSVAFSPSGHQLLSGSTDRFIKLWELSRPPRRKGTTPGPPRAGVCKTTFVGHKGFVLSVSMTPDGKWVVSGGKDRGVQFWSVDGQPQFMVQGHQNFGTKSTVLP